MRVWTFLFSLYFCVGFERSGGVLHMIESVRAHAEIGSNGVWRRWTARLVRLLLLDRFGRFSCREDRVQARGQSREPNQIHEEKEPIRVRADDQYKLAYCRASNQVSHKHVQNTTATYSTTWHRSSNPNQEKEGRIWHSGFPSRRWNTLTNEQALLDSLRNQISEYVETASHVPCCNRHEPWSGE